MEAVCPILCQKELARLALTLLSVLRGENRFRIEGGLITQYDPRAMSSVHSPPEKKRLSYDRDHYAKGKYDKAFRKGWPTKKRKATRSFRHAADALTRAAGFDAESDAKIPAISQRPLDKWGVTPLRQSVARKLHRRVSGTGAKKRRRTARDRGLSTPL